MVGELLMRAIDPKPRGINTPRQRPSGARIIKAEKKRNHRGNWIRRLVNGVNPIR